MKFAHVNIVAKDWKKLAEFYEKVFGCIQILPERSLSGEWLEKGTGVKNARIKGVHLRLPGFGENGPTLEIFQYNQGINNTNKEINREGLAHTAFLVDDINQTKKAILENGGKEYGELITKEIEGVGTITFQYLTDIEGNIIEIQTWK